MIFCINVHTLIFLCNCGLPKKDTVVEIIIVFTLRTACLMEFDITDRIVINFFDW